MARVPVCPVCLMPRRECVCDDDVPPFPPGGDGDGEDDAA